MKVFQIILAVFLGFATIACKDSKTTQGFADKQASLAKNLQTVNLAIKGMTCEIGCAKTIEAKLSKTQGVVSSKVDFAKKQGTFTYDANITSKETLISTIEGIADGALYKATETTSSSCLHDCKKACHENGEKDCDKACAEKCGHKAGATCKKACESDKKTCHTEKKECKTGDKKACCKK